jgi:RNA polymerase sigma-70 factor (ECF subfamily)
LDDLALTDALNKRDPAAARLLVEQHFDPLYRFLRQLTRHVEDAEDLAQQTLIRVHRNAAKFDGRVRLRTWIFAIALAEYRRWRRRRLWLPLLCDTPSKGDLAENTADSEVLLCALSKLSPSMRASFLLHYVEGLSIEEIAVIEGVPEGTVKSRLHFARTRLKTLLEQEEFYVTEPCQP